VDVSSSLPRRFNNPNSDDERLVSHGFLLPTRFGLDGSCRKSAKSRRAVDENEAICKADHEIVRELVLNYHVVNTPCDEKRSGARRPKREAHQQTSRDRPNRAEAQLDLLEARRDYR
jgi:hypothetical protein